MSAIEDLGLSLSLPCHEHPSPLELTIPSTVTSRFTNHKQGSCWNDSFASLDGTRSFIRSIDVSRTKIEEDIGVASSPNSTISSLSGKRIEKEHGNDACSRGISDEEDGDTSRKKLRLSKDQACLLEESFKEQSTLNPKQKQVLAKQSNLRPRQVEVWFQNRRARTKLKQTEVDCKFMKKRCEKLTDENKRLQKEVQDLRALKLSPQLYMQMAPSTTLTVCPSCERVSTSFSNKPTAATIASTTTNSNTQQQDLLGALKQRVMPINPWAIVTPVQYRQFDVPHLRS